MKTDSEPSCPMCRGNLYFKGMGKVVDRWEDEAYEKKWDEVYTDALEETMEEFESVGDVMDGESILLYMEDLQMAYQKLRDIEDKGFKFSWEEIREILRHPYCMYDLIVSRRSYVSWDDNEEIRLRQLFVSNYPSWNGPSIVRAV